jgi:hypothetical protein
MTRYSAQGERKTRRPPVGPHEATADGPHRGASFLLGSRSPGLRLRRASNALITSSPSSLRHRVVIDRGIGDVVERGAGGVEGASDRDAVSRLGLYDDTRDRRNPRQSDDELGFAPVHGGVTPHSSAITRPNTANASPPVCSPTTPSTQPIPPCCTFLTAAAVWGPKPPSTARRGRGVQGSRSLPSEVSRLSPCGPLLTGMPISVDTGPRGIRPIRQPPSEAPTQPPMRGPPRPPSPRRTRCRPTPNE